LLYARRFKRRQSAFEAAATSEFAFELDQVSEGVQRFAVLLAIESSEHAGVVAERSDRRAKAVAERLARCGAPEVVVTACPGRLPNDLQLTGIGPKLEHGLANEILVECEPFAVRAAGVQVLEREPEPP
jgi:hypothetical protein